MKEFMGLPFDEEVFIHAWGEYPDTTTTALLDCGVIKVDPTITSALQNGGNYFTAPFYKPLDIDPANYDGKTDVPFKDVTGGAQSGVVFGRTQGYRTIDFASDITSADPMGNITAKVGKAWARYDQNLLQGILDAVLGVASNNVKEVQDDGTEKLIAGINESIATIFGANRVNVKALVMDTLTAVKFENIGLLHFRKGVDAKGMEVATNIADFLGYTVVINESTGGKIYLLGEGAILTADPKLKHGIELSRDPVKNGGEDYLITRKRNVLHPNGFSFKKPTADSPTDADLKNKSNYTKVFDEKDIYIGAINLKAGSASATE